MAADTTLLEHLLNVELPAMKLDPSKGDEAYRCGVNGGIDRVAARIRLLLAENADSVPPSGGIYCGRCDLTVPSRCGSDDCPVTAGVKEVPNGR